MSPLAAVLARTFSPWFLIPVLLIEWWAVWFTLGRNFTTTSLMALTANAASLLVSALLVASGALGDPEAEVLPFGLPALVGAVLAAVAATLAVEALVLRGLMRRLRPGWSWDRYDLMIFGAAHGAPLILLVLVSG